MNTTLMERARSILSGTSLKKKFWEDAACYLINRFPTLAPLHKTHVDVWMGKKPSIQHLHVFGCEVYSHVPKEKQSKLDNKEVKCIFIGYGVGVKGYNFGTLSIGMFRIEEMLFLEKLKASPHNGVAKSG